MPRLYIDIARSVVYLTVCTKGDAVYEGCAVESTRRMRGWARKMERGCRRPCKNKELVFFLVRKSVNTGGVFATPAALRCVELMDGV